MPPPRPMDHGALKLGDSFLNAWKPLPSSEMQTVRVPFRLRHRYGLLTGNGSGTVAQGTGAPGAPHALIPSRSSAAWPLSWKPGRRDHFPDARTCDMASFTAVRPSTQSCASSYSSVTEARSNEFSGSLSFDASM